MADNTTTWPHVQFDFTGRTVLVTGGSNGIGEGIARAYLAAGATVHITGTRVSAEDYNKDLSGFCYHQLLLTDNASIDALAEAIPTLDILINNAGTSLPGGKDEREPEVFAEAVAINLTSVYRISTAFRDKLAQSDMPGGASMIGIASLTSYFGLDIVPGYGAAKAGLVQLMKTLAISWADDGIRTNAVAAGLVESNMTAPMLGIEEATAPFIQRTPMKRVGKPNDIAGVVLFLSSPAAGFVTGQTLLADGGYSVMG